MARVAHCMLLIVAVACHAIVFASDQESAKPIGAGAFPLTPMHASAWFAQRADQGAKVLTLMIYFEGSPGWHDQPTNFNWQINADPATIDMSVGDTAIYAKYWPSRSSLELFGSTFRLAAHNVFLVSDIDGARPSVTGLGAHDLSFASDDNPATVLLARNPELRFALAGIDEPKPKNTSVPAEVRSWDEEGLRLLGAGNSEDDAKACQLFRRAAEKGYAASQYRLGVCFGSGRGVEQNYSTANEWYEKAAKQGNIDAQYKLAHSHRVGRGTEINLRVALRWYKKAADNGDLDALHNVGWMYATGQGVEADAAEAFAWFLIAAKKGKPASQYEVAQRLREGNGAPSDLTECYAWLLVLQAERKRFAPTYWSQVQELIRRVESNLDPNFKAEAAKLSRERLREISRETILRLAK